jgi:hypothetical protein
MSHISQCYAITSFSLGVRDAWESYGGSLYCGTDPVPRRSFLLYGMGGIRKKKGSNLLEVCGG